MRKDASSNTVDEYLANVDPEFRPLLEQLRALITAAAPNTTEKISYQIPCFYLDGKPLVGFGGFKAHCSFFPMDGDAIEQFRDELRDFAQSTGTIRFTLDHPLPDDLVTRMVQARVAAIEAKTANGGK